MSSTYSTALACMEFMDGCTQPFWILSDEEREYYENTKLGCFSIFLNIVTTRVTGYIMTSSYTLLPLRNSEKTNHSLILRIKLYIRDWGEGLWPYLLQWYAQLQPSFALWHMCRELSELTSISAKLLPELCVCHEHSELSRWSVWALVGGPDDTPLEPKG